MPCHRLLPLCPVPVNCPGQVARFNPPVAYWDGQSSVSAVLNQALQLGRQACQNKAPQLLLVLLPSKVRVAAGRH